MYLNTHKRVASFKLNFIIMITKPHPEAKLVKLEDADIFVLKGAFYV